MKKILSIFVLTIATMVVLSAQTVTMDLDAIIEAFPMYEKVNAESNEHLKEVNAKMEAIQKSESSAMDNHKQAKAMAEVAEYQDELKAKMQAPFRDQALEHIATVAEKQGYDLVLDINTGEILYANERLDQTRAVLDLTSKDNFKPEE